MTDPPVNDVVSVFLSPCAHIFSMFILNRQVYTVVQVMAEVAARAPVTTTSYEGPLARSTAAMKNVWDIGEE